MKRLIATLVLLICFMGFALSEEGCSFVQQEELLVLSKNVLLENKPFSYSVYEAILLIECLYPGIPLSEVLSWSEYYCLDFSSRELLTSGDQTEMTCVFSPWVWVTVYGEHVEKAILCVCLTDDTQDAVSIQIDLRKTLHAELHGRSNQTGCSLNIDEITVQENPMEQTATAISMIGAEELIKIMKICDVLSIGMSVEDIEAVFRTYSLYIEEWTIEGNSYSVAVRSGFYQIFILDFEFEQDGLRDVVICVDPMTLINVCRQVEIDLYSQLPVGTFTVMMPGIPVLLDQ